MTVSGTARFYCHAGGGDFCLPGAEYQPLHSDMQIKPSKTEYGPDSH